jgi:AcrR family transcriptional regulator
MTTRVRGTRRRARAGAQPVDFKRRAPVQARAKATIEAIVEATAQILERDGGAALSTNAIAQRAGISIGTLYQYFRDKDEILVAIARRLQQSDTAATQSAIARADLDGAEPERLVVRALLGFYRERRATRGAAINAMVSAGLAAERARSVAAIAEAIATRGVLPAAAGWVLTRAVNGVLHATIEEDSPLCAQELEDELVRLIGSFVRHPPQPRR